MEGPLIITKFLFDEEKKTIVKDVFFSLIMSFITVLSKNAIEEHLFLNKYNMAQYALLFVVYTALFYLSIRVIALIRKRAMTGTVVADTVKLPRVKLFLLMFAAWTPYLLVFLPGVANYDTVNQVNDFFDGVSPVPFGFVKGQETVNVFLNAHHPIVPTFIFSFFIWIGVILGSATMGFLLYIIFQMLLGAAVISGILCDLYEGAATKAGRRVVKGLRLFYMFMPFIPMYMICMLKNTLHSILFIMLIYVFYRYFTGKDEKPAGSWILFFILEVLLCTTLNTGVFVVVFTSIGIAIMGGKKRAWFIFTAVLSAVIWFVVFPKIIYPMANIYPGGKQELYGTFFQQTARLIRDKEEAITESDKEIISAVLDYEKIKENYSFETTDPVKETFKIHSTKEELNKYLAMWLRMGIKHPVIYLRAIWPICGNFFGPGAGIQIFGDIPKSDGVFGQISNVMPESLSSRATALYFKVTITPIISIIFQTVIYAFWIPVYLFYFEVLGAKKGERRQELIILLPLFVSILFLIVSPMNYSRYALCLIFASPIAAALLTVRNKKS